jgi:uncharacterized repeat protein (TIGR03803 family)
MALGLALMLVPPAAAAEITLLHSFSGKPDGRNPYGSPSLSGSTLYGMTGGGGAADCGIVYRLNTDGSAYRVLHAFTGPPSDGRGPAYTSPTVSNSTLYGVTWYGGAVNWGTIFKVSTDGSRYEVLYSFQERLLTKGGVLPQGTLVVSGSTVYGTAACGGRENKGTVFRIGTDGSGFKVLHAFSGGRKDGDTPHGGLTLAGSTLYGMTQKGGSNDYGTIYKLSTGGAAFALLHTFTGQQGGDFPEGGLVLDAGTFYGMTSDWKAHGHGKIFRIGTDGGGFNVLHAFGGASDGRAPTGTLILYNSALYGMTSSGGMGNQGTLFRINTDGGGFEVLHSFAGGAETKGFTDAGLAQLKDLPCLEELTLYGPGFTDAAVPQLMELRGLKKVRLVDTGLKPATFDELRRKAGQVQWLVE